ncbi:MAG: replicative DNA helicase [Planctomycetaceae bacterium]|nr:replicative DNA helicase [Planctomycetaceae bacterium]
MSTARAVSRGGPGDLPPQNLDAEKSLLGSMLLDSTVVDDTVEIVQPRHFYLTAHQLVAEAIYRLHETHFGGVDVVTVAEELEKKGELAEAGGPAGLAELLESVPHAGHAKYYAGIVRDKFVQRSLRNACTTILQSIAEEGQDTDDLLTSAEQKIFQIVEQQGDTERLEIRDILFDALDSIKSRLEQDGSVSGVCTGLTELDSLTTGLHPAQLIIVAARPSMGKTAFVCNIAKSVAVAARKKHEADGRPATETPAGGVILFSLEQSRLELAERMLCIYGEFNGHHLKKGELEPDEQLRLLEASSRLSELPIFIDDSPGRSMAQISGICRRLKRRHQIGLVVIDYLQLIEPEDKNAPREQQVAQIARRLKFLGKEIDVPVIALAQLNRGVDLRQDKQPKLADLRESGAIEQDADLVLFLHRPDAYDPEDRPGEAECIVAKHRNGPTGIITMTWLRESMRFVDHSNIDVPDGGYFSGDTSGDF